jgi:FkbH-like protein
MKWSQIIKRNRELAGSMSGPVKKIILLSNSTIFQLKEILELDLRETGLAVEVDLGDYDNILQDSKKFAEYDAVIIFWELSNLLEGFHYKYNLFNEDELSLLINKVELEINLTLDNLKAVPLVLVNKFTAMPFDTQFLLESKLQQIAGRLNDTLKKAVSHSQTIVDLEKIIALTGLDRSIDHRQFQTSKSLYTKELFYNYSQQIKPAFMASNGIIKKVLVLDCDNTLWSGVLGEDGENNLEMSDLSTRGKSFSEVQYLIKSFEKKGVLLALCSKNNSEDVDQILKNHPDMILKNHNFVAKKVNWIDKAKNLIEISHELNLGLDSFVFVDDSEFELGLIKTALPEVKTVMVPKDISEYPTIIRNLESDFFSFSSTHEDTSKTLMYKHERTRAEASKAFGSIDDYLASLGLCIKIYLDKNVSAVRAAQMTQKTNQFNLRTYRYTEADINSFIVDTNHMVSTFSLSDMYGDYGTTGLCIVELYEDYAFIDTLLMSCRVIGRNVEYSFLTQIIKELSEYKIKIINAEFILTNKNQQVEKFYENLGFVCLSENNNKKIYSLNLEKYINNEKEYIKIIN